MKKTIILYFALIMTTIMLSACGGGSKSNTTPSEKSSSVSSVETSTQSNTSSSSLSSVSTSANVSSSSSLTSENNSLSSTASSLGQSSLSSSQISSSSSSDSIASKRNLPPAPDAQLAAATLTGVDVNQNGVRDEVELEISSGVANDKDYFASIKVAAAYQKMLSASPVINRDQALQLFANTLCRIDKTASIFRRPNGETLVDATFNTPERMTSYDVIVDKVQGGFMGDELPPCNQ